MNEVAIIDFALSRSNQVFVVWNFLIVVSLGVISVIGSASDIARRQSMRWPLIIGYSIFTASNLYALLTLRAQKIEFLELLPNGLLDRTYSWLVPYSITELLSFHLGVDILVILTLMLLSRRGRDRV